MAHLWKSFVDALAPPKRDEQPRREGVALNRMVGERPLSRHELSNQAGGSEVQSSAGVSRGHES